MCEKIRFVNITSEASRQHKLHELQPAPPVSAQWYLYRNAFNASNYSMQLPSMPPRTVISSVLLQVLRARVSYPVLLDGEQAIAFR